MANPCIALRTLNYNEVRNEGGFKAESMKDVVEIFPAGRALNKQEVDDLVTSIYLKNLKCLDLTDQAEITNEVIEKFACKNPTFSRVIRLDLNGTDITDEAIDAISRSKYLGSVQDLPQTSGKYGIPSATVTVYVRNTVVRNTTQRETFNFHIECKPPYPTILHGSTDYGVKIVEIRNW